MKKGTRAQKVGSGIKKNPHRQPNTIKQKHPKVKMRTTLSH